MVAGITIEGAGPGALEPRGTLQEAGPCPGSGASPEVLSGWSSNVGGARRAGQA